MKRNPGWKGRSLSRLVFGVALTLGSILAESLSASPSSAETPGEALLHAFAGKFSALDSFEAEFSQDQEWVGQDESPVWKGTLYLKRPNLFRVEYTEPPGHLQVSDGRTVWTYVPENHEVLAAKIDSTAGPGGDVLRWILETGQAQPGVNETEVGDKPALEMTLLPAEGLGLSQVRLWIRPKSLELVRYEITDSSGNRNLYSLTRQRENPRLKDELFHFVPPEGVPVVQIGAP